MAVLLRLGAMKKQPTTINWRNVATRDDEEHNMNNAIRMIYSAATFAGIGLTTLAMAQTTINITSLGRSNHGIITIAARGEGSELCIAQQ
ncbi:hypothetical protein [Vreelandella sp. EE22]